MTSRQRSAVLIVEDESIVAHDLQQTLTALGYDAFAVAASADEALARAAEKRPDVVLVDIRIKGRMDGITTSQALQERFGIPVIYLTAHADDATLERAKQTRPHGYLLKPVKPAELKSAIEIAIFKHQDKGDGGISTADRPPVASPAPTLPGRAPGTRVVRRQVEQILSSPDFDASRRSKEFLRFIVDEALAGRGEDLTQSAIATRVFGRRDDFDAIVDPIVRIQAGRLRRSLERYYLLSGKHDAVRIALPRGTYVPTFQAHVESGPGSGDERPPEPQAPAFHPDAWPLVVVNLFDNTGSGPEHGAAAARLQEELVLELGRYGDVRVLPARGQEPQGPPGRARFALRGRVWDEDGDVRVSARLADLSTGEQLWGDSYYTTPRPGRWSGSADDIARVIAARVGSEEGLIVQLLAGQRRREKPASITPYGAILMSYEFFLVRDPAGVGPALQALQQVVEADPDCGLAWTRLARLCLANYTFEVTDIPTPIDDAVTYAQRGVRVDTTSRRARCILGSSLLIKGELAAARNEVEQALRLSPDSLAYLEVIGFQLTLLGDGERGPALIRSARERNPHCLSLAGFGLWFDHLRRGEIERAYQEALEYRDPTFFWRALMRACCLGLLGRGAEAELEVAELLREKPDFAARGRGLVGHYVKLPDVTARIVDGLARAGLTLA